MSDYKEVEGIDVSTYAGKAASAVKLKARGVLGDELLTFKLIDFVSFMLLQSKFMSKGIYISDTNREEAYIKVIELGDESLIGDLESYINLLDSIKKIDQQRQEYYDVINQLKVLPDYNDEERVNGIVESYLRR